MSCAAKTGKSGARWDWTDTSACIAGANPSAFAELGEALAAEGWNVVLTGNASVAAAMRQPAISIAGPETSLIAAAMRTPTARLATDVRQTLREARELLATASFSPRM